MAASTISSGSRSPLRRGRPRRPVGAVLAGRGRHLPPGGGDVAWCRSSWRACMARRWRVGLASSPKMLGVATAAVLIIALLITGRWLNSGAGPGRSLPPAGSGPADSQAPYRIGGKVDCPLLWPVLAMSNHTSYPAGHPTRPPPSATPVACYQTTARAASAGYAPAPLPAGALPPGCRPAWLRGSLPGAAAHRSARFAATAAVRRAGHLPARAGAAVPPGWVRGPTRLRRRSGRLRRPFDRRDADP